MVRRLRSWWWDYLVVLAWLVLVFLTIGLPQILGWLDLSSVWSDPVSADLAITLLTVVPWFVYLVWTESASPHATWGKQRAHLTVTTSDGDDPAAGAVIVRNLIKVLPWQLGHMGTMRLATMANSPPFAIWLEVGSLVVLALIVIPIVLGRRGVHDLVAGTRVVRSN